jgi:AraC family carnitine catabolism transcriptional activator
MFEIFRQDGPEPVGFLLVPKFSSMAFFSAVEPLRVANRLAGRPLFSWRALSIDGEPVEASNGMRLMVDGKLEESGPLPTLILVSGFDPQTYETPLLLRHLRRLSRAGTRLGALDTGAHLLAKAGLLGAGPVTLHWEAVPAFVEEFPDIAVSDELFEIGPRLFTCAGGTAAMDMMLSMIGRKHGEPLAIAVSEQFIHDRIRNSDDHQRMSLPSRVPSTDRKLLAIIRAMEENIEQPLGGEELAARGGITVRQMERLFKRDLGLSPAAHYRALRLDRARALLLQTDMAVIDVAFASGFSAPGVFTRAYARHFGLPPREDRRRPGYLGAGGANPMS